MSNIYDLDQIAFLRRCAQHCRTNGEKVKALNALERYENKFNNKTLTPDDVTVIWALNVQFSARGYIKHERELEERGTEK